MKISTVTATIALFIMVLIVGAFLTLQVLVILALLKYLRTKDVQEEKRIVKKSLGETLKEYRTKCKMTQEFVAESIGVSRQAVSKWEQGVSDPSTTNLLALAKRKKCVHLLKLRLHYHLPDNTFYD